MALNSIAGHVRRPSVTRRSQLFASTNDGDDVDDSNLKQPGMAKAFRLLESLDSLDDPEEYIPAPEKINVDAVLDRESLKDTGVEVAPEKEMAVYIEMVEELEHNDDAEAYAELLEEMGSSVMRTGDDTYSQVLSDLGGTRPATKKAAGNVAENDDSAPSPPVLSSDVSSEASAEQLMENALQEALREVKVNNPRLSASLLDDREIMREIEGIFNQGNERLIANLEDIRREQVQWCRLTRWRCARAVCIDDACLALFPPRTRCCPFSFFFIIRANLPIFILHCPKTSPPPPPPISKPSRPPVPHPKPKPRWTIFTMAPFACRMLKRAL